MAKRRETNVFSLAFLDIMSCGFGAVILIYIVINHATETTTKNVSVDLMAEIQRVEELVRDETERLVQLRNTAAETDDEIVTTSQLSIRVAETIKMLEAELADLNEAGASRERTIEDLKSELKELELEAANLEGAVAAEESSGSALRSILGQGDRQYLTGLKIGGQHIVILLDASASMLDKTIVNIIRRRNLPEAQKISSPKWQRAIGTVEWIMANMPKDAYFQLITFNETASSAVAETGTDWLRAIERTDTDAALEGIRSMAPAGGTSLYQAFAMVNRMDPLPDNVFLIVDSLPTMGEKASSRTVIDNRERVALFSEALEMLPAGSPVNVILFPMEGDPVASPSYWRLAQITGGSFLSPPDDWP
ncbi:MAG: VWA domain-containing protein [Proteobacteria bacterium]|nr:VWA domain-containing protein [Pseudomonadota bacterium]